MLKVGDAAPDIDLPNAAMEMVRLADQRGKRNVVLLRAMPETFSI